VNKNSISFAAAIVVGLALISVGVAAVGAPKLASAMFGVAAGDDSARVYVYATGMRDITIGCLLFALSALRAGPRVLGFALMILALIPIGDAIIVWRNAVDVNAGAIALHVSSAIVFFALGFWLRLGVRLI
jgi:hypothetical protein